MKKILIVALALGLTGTASAAPRDDKVYAAVEANRAGFLDLLKQLVNIDSGTGDVAGGNRVAAVLAARLKALGAEVSRPPTETPGLPDNLMAVFHGSGKGRILIVSHFDTVFGPDTATARPFSIAGTRAHGPGVGDEKAGLVNAITALKILHDAGFKNFASITLLVDNSEERGSPGVSKLIAKLSAQNDVELNTEPGDPPDVLTVWRKASASVVISVKGRAAHAGMAPQDGRNAAMELIHQLDSFEGAFPHYGDGITANLTLMQAGVRPNIIPDSAEATVNVRYRVPAQFDQVMARFREDAKKTLIPDTKVTVSSSTNFPPLIENAKIDALADRAQAIYGELGKSIGRGGNGGASESAIAMAAGTPALDGLALVGGDFHTDHEWIDLGSLNPRLYLLTRLLMDLGANPPKK